ncbi:MAG TPA: hypothetical protein VFK57_18925, partial [Vicinamibacterales bacterium]|nr:hypothetical protein [Vicinamibacterales bacterium]
RAGDLRGREGIHAVGVLHAGVGRAGASSETVDSTLQNAAAALDGPCRSCRRRDSSRRRLIDRAIFLSCRLEK